MRLTNATVLQAFYEKQGKTFVIGETDIYTQNVSCQLIYEDGVTLNMEVPLEFLEGFEFSNWIAKDLIAQMRSWAKSEA